MIPGDKFLIFNIFPDEKQIQYIFDLSPNIYFYMYAKEFGTQIKISLIDHFGTQTPEILEI